MLISRECVKSTHQNPFVRVYLLWKTVEVWDRGGGGDPFGMASPLPFLLRPRQCHKAVWYLCGESGQSHNRKDPDSFWSQCGNMFFQEEAGIIRRGGNHREEGEGESLVTAPSKAVDVGLPLPLGSLA